MSALRLALPAILALATACTVGFDADGDRFECRSDGDCGSGFLCNRFAPGADGEVGVCQRAADGCTPTAEVCDNLDNDCDGQTDEDFDLGATCEGKGICPAGALECDGPSGVRCSTHPGGSAYVAANELCDGLDNNCDGLTDEGFDLGATCSVDGVCGVGTRECDGTESTRCSTAPGASADGSQPEICDGADNDCDGLTDEELRNICGGCALLPHMPGTACDGDDADQCERGTWRCADGDPDDVTCEEDPDENRVELCDGEDNNCDGVTDEGVTNACGGCAVLARNPGDPCDGADDDRCEGGRWACDPGGGGDVLVCDEAPDQSISETCDGADNDCDGDTDEGFGLGEACTGRGECGSGRIECSDTGATRCSSNPGGSDYPNARELCDGLDNDCDGDSDEDFEIGVACASGGRCGFGVFECANPATARCSTSRGGSNDQSVTERCANDVDDDCDGETDESEGLEVCDGFDNDCDGQTDEDFGGGLICDPPGECGEGFVECVDLNTARCSTGREGSNDQSAPERCDGLDNDCDGETDEDFDVGMPCDGAGWCGAGVIECDGLEGRRCSTEAGGSEDMSTPERCGDSVDNDCDGETDEAHPEVCDGLDNNCDGQTDEGVDGCRDGGLLIPAGNFVAGDGAQRPSACYNPPAGDDCGCDVPTAPVHISDFYMDVFEVTNAQFGECVNAGVCTAPRNLGSRTRATYFFEPAFFNHPVIVVDWFQAAAYCDWKGKRLPTETEWEKAARGSTQPLGWPWGDTADCSMGVYGRSDDDPNCPDNPTDTVDVTRRPQGASPYGMMHMAGNIYEWVNDWYDACAYQNSTRSDPQGPNTGTDKILRGGGFLSGAVFSRTGVRLHTTPTSPFVDVGFRCAADP